MAKRRGVSGSKKRYYTTHQIAKMLGVTIPTVVNWCECNKLIAHRTPGGHRRIAHTDLIAFSKAQGMPLPFEAPSGRRILIVDDEQDFSEMLRDYLEMKSFDVEIAESGFQAGLRVARFKPDLILMDIMMPDMDGFEVNRMLRSDPATRHIPVIACTAYRDPSIDARVTQERFEGFIEKPLKMANLVELIKRTLRIEA
jgi:excisionase family DNA binding protein